MERAVLIKMLEAVGADPFSNIKKASIRVDGVLFQEMVLFKVDSNQTNESSSSKNPQTDLNIFSAVLIDYQKNSLADVAFQFLLKLWREISNLLNSKGLSEDEHKIYALCQTRLNVFFILFLRGLSNLTVTHSEISSTVMMWIFENMNTATMFISSIMEVCKNEELCDSDAMDQAFNPILDKLRVCLSSVIATNRFGNNTDLPVRILNWMLSIKLKSGSKPIAELLVKRPDFSPEVVTNLSGREFIRSSYLGLMLFYSVIDDDDEELLLNSGKVYFPNCDWRDPQRIILFSDFQAKMSRIRTELHGIFYSLLANNSTRQDTLNYIENVIKQNRKRTQLQGNRAALANNGVMINFFCVMLRLSEKIQLEKVQENYIFNKKNRIHVEKETRIYFKPEEVEEYEKTLDVDYEPKFTTECFYLTIHALIIGINPAISHLKYIKERIRDSKNELREIEEIIKRNGARYASNPMYNQRVKLIKHRQEQLNRVYLCNECMLKDEELLKQCVYFVNNQLSLLLLSVCPSLINRVFQISPELPPASPTKSFGTFPESYIESALDFLLFLFNEHHTKILLQNSFNYQQILVILICSLDYFKNPYLASKVVTVIFAISPVINPDAPTFFNQITCHPIAGKRLFPSLSKFYTDVESTGANSEFYDKFNIRRLIQVIFKCMWSDPLHRNSVSYVAANITSDFVRFINMVINDATFLLDESLSGLKKIHDIENLMNNEANWSKFSQEDQHQKINSLRESKRSVRTWSVLCNETMEFFILLTKENTDIFCDSLGDRIAAMLNYNIIQLCGPKCANLKVSDAKARFEWDPRKLLSQIVEIYLNLSSDRFAENIAHDERSYTPDAFNAVLEKITTKRILEMCATERFKNLAEVAERHYKAKIEQEIDFGDDIPEEFKDELVYTLMTDPTVLPSGQVVDRKNILRHLLSDKTNPFTRQPLTIEELKPDDDLKKRIDDWVKEKLAARHR